MKKEKKSSKGRGKIYPEMKRKGRQGEVFLLLSSLDNFRLSSQLDRMRVFFLLLWLFISLQSLSPVCWSSRYSLGLYGGGPTSLCQVSHS